MKVVGKVPILVLICTVTERQRATTTTVVKSMGSTASTATSTISTKEGGSKCKWPKYLAWHDTSTGFLKVQRESKRGTNNSTSSSEQDDRCRKIWKLTIRQSLENRTQVANLAGIERRSITFIFAFAKVHQESGVLIQDQRAHAVKFTVLICMEMCHLLDQEKGIMTYQETKELRYLIWPAGVLNTSAKCWCSFS